MGDECMYKKILISVVLCILFLSAVMTTAYAKEPASAASGGSYFKVTSSTLNMRKAPNTSASVVEELKKGAVVQRADAKRYIGNSQAWYKVKSINSGKTGYVVVKYITKTTAPDYSRLKSISADKGMLSPAFSPDRLKYELYLDSSLNEFTLSYGRWSTAAVTVKVDGAALSGSHPKITFRAGGKITLTSVSGGKTSVYEITMKREKADASKLKGISVKGVKFSFKTDTLKYNISIPYKIFESTVTLQKCNYYATTEITANGEKCEDGYLPLFVGKNIVTVTCTSPLGEKTVYTLTITRAKPSADEKETMSPLERRFVETAFQLLPARNPFVLAYEEATGRNIKTYSVTKNGSTISGVPFEYGGGGDYLGFASRWWSKTGVARYPVGGMDCAEYMHWIYKQLGYDVETSSSGLFLSGVVGRERKLPGIPTHKVITTLKDAKIGDITYNSENFTYTSGHGNHTSMFLGTARKLGIEDTIRKYYKNFPVDAYLVIDVGWADGTYYHNMIRKLNVAGRDDLGGVGIQFFTSIKQNGKYIYKSPYLSSKKSYSWKDPKSGQTFGVAANLERNGRLMQYKPNSNVKYIMNLSRPIKRND